MLSFSLLEFNNAKRFLRCQSLKIIKIHSSWILNADTPGSTAGEEEAVRCGERNGAVCTSLARSGLKEPGAMRGMIVRKVPGITIITICNKRGRERGSWGEKLSSQLNS